MKRPVVKSLALTVLGWLAKRDVFWNVARSAHERIALVVRVAERVRLGGDHPDAQVQRALDLLPDLTVQNGPFAGMRYPEASSVGSQSFPKLLGSYERELAPIIEQVCRTPYEEVVDIGCAEGYYAVGLAMRIPGARVWAYDTDSRAVSLCRRMAELNGVAERVQIGGFCSPETLSQLPLSNRTLIISDCEGFELELFTPEVVAQLGRCDVLIETHDFIDPVISSTLRERFAATHDLTLVESVDDVRKVHSYRYPEIDDLPVKVRRHLLSEYRPSVMEWLWLEPRST